MGLLDVAAQREVADGSCPRFSGVGDCWSNARRLEKQSFANPVTRYDDLSRFYTPEHFGRNGEPRDDDVRSLGVEARNSAALVGRHVDEHVEDVLEIGTSDPRRMDGSRGKDSLA